MSVSSPRVSISSSSSKVVVCRWRSQCIVNSGSFIAEKGENDGDVVLLVEGSRSTKDRALRAQYVYPPSGCQHSQDIMQYHYEP